MLGFNLLKNRVNNLANVSHKSLVAKHQRNLVK